MYGRTGANHPNFGITPTNALSVNVNSLDGTLVNSFSSRVAAAKWLGVSDRSVLNYIRSGKEFKGKYILSSSLLSLSVMHNPPSLRRRGAGWGMGPPPNLGL